MFDEESPEDKIIGWLEDEGALVMEGVDENGEIVMKMVPEKLKQVFPELYDSFMHQVDQSIMLLYDAGYVDISYDEELRPRFSITEAGTKILKRYGYRVD
jgi:hypothetical protein